jgi:hypothetical protein
MPDRKEPKIHAAAVLSLTICVPAKRYLGPVLGAVDRYRSDVDSQGRWVSDPVNVYFARDPKAAIVRFATGIEHAAATMENKVVGTGYPDELGGERGARTLLGIVGALRQAYRVACWQAEWLDATSVPALGSGRDRIETTLDVANQALAEAATRLAVDHPTPLFNEIAAALLGSCRSWGGKSGDDLPDPNGP